MPPLLEGQIYMYMYAALNDVSGNYFLLHVNVHGRFIFYRSCTD